MDGKGFTPRRKKTVPGTLTISLPVAEKSLTSGLSLSPLPHQNEQAFLSLGKTVGRQASRGGESLPEQPKGRNKSLSSAAYWTGKGGLQSPRLYGVSPREIHAYEQKKSPVESVPEEDAEELEERNERGGRVGETLTFYGGARNMEEVKLLADGGDNSKPQETLVVDDDKGQGSRLTSSDWSLPFREISGIGILPDTLGHFPPSTTPEIDENCSRSFNRSRISAIGNFTLPNKQQQPSTKLHKELPPLPNTPISPFSRVSPLPSSSKLAARSRAVSLTPSLVAELELEELQNNELGKGSTKVPHARKGRRGTKSEKRISDVPIKSSFSTDSSTESESENKPNEADFMPLEALPRQFLNYMEIDKGDPSVGRKRSIRRKPVLRESMLVEGWSGKSRSGSVADEMKATETGASRDGTLLSPRQQAHPLLDEQSPGLNTKILLSEIGYYEGYALRFKSGVYIPLNTVAPPLAIDQNLLYKIVPKKEVNDGRGTAYHTVIPNALEENGVHPGSEVYTYDETQRGFVLAHLPLLVQQEATRDEDAISFEKEVQWPVPKEEAEKVNHQQSSSSKCVLGSKSQAGSVYRSRSKISQDRSFNELLGDPVHPQSMARKKQAKLLGLGGGTRGVGNVDYGKGLARANSVKFEARENTRDEGNEGWDHSGEGEQLARNDSVTTTVGGGSTENGIYVTREFEVGVKPRLPDKQQEPDSDTDREARNRKRKLSLKGQSWLDVAAPSRAPAAEQISGGKANFSAVNEDGVSPIEEIQLRHNNTVFETPPRLPLYSPPEDASETQVHTPLLSTASLEQPLPSRNPEPLISQSTAISSSPPLPPLPLQSPRRSPRRHVVVTLNLHRSRSEHSRTSKIQIPVSSATSGWDDYKVFDKLRKEYVAMTDSRWRAWYGLRGIKWVGITEVCN